MGLPTLITKTQGFWDYEKFKNYENIIFLEDNKLDLWKNEINFILKNKKTYEIIKEKGIKTVSQNFNLQIFYEKLIRIIEDD